jgi:hypothetical protein
METREPPPPPAPPPNTTKYSWFDRDSVVVFGGGRRGLTQSERFQRAFCKLSGSLKKIVIILLVVILSAGCGPALGQKITSGVEGHVTVGPVCPVVQADHPCPDKPFQATLTVLNLHGKKVLTIQTDENGYYHVPLKPGNYVLHPESPNLMPNAAEQSFSVLDGQFTTLDIVYDSGIR